MADDGNITGDVAAKLLGISLNELTKLTGSGVIPRVSNNKYQLVSVVRGYIDYVKDDAKRKNLKPTQVEAALHLDMSDRNLRDFATRLKLNLKEMTLDSIRIAYIRNQREIAAGRGGDEAGNLARAKTAESIVSTKIKEVDLNERLKNLAPAEICSAILCDWAAYANREFTGAVDKLIMDVESENSINIDPERTAGTISPAITRIQDYAKKLGQRIVGGGEDILTTE